MKMTVLEALQKCGKVTLILSTGYYSYSTQHHFALRKQDILIECPAFGPKNEQMLVSLRHAWRQAIEEKIGRGLFFPMSVYICDGWKEGGFFPIAKFLESEISEALSALA